MQSSAQNDKIYLAILSRAHSLNQNISKPQNGHKRFFDSSKI
ncbi:hypothetical protein [Helicobacter sp. T3_23-1056]